MYCTFVQCALAALLGGGEIARAFEQELCKVDNVMWGKKCEIEK